MARSEVVQDEVAAQDGEMVLDTEKRKDPRDTTDADYVAMKVVHLPSGSDVQLAQCRLKAAAQELNILHKVKGLHFFPELLCAFESPENLYIVMSKLDFYLYPASIVTVTLLTAADINEHI